MRNHAREILACDFFVTVTARFRLLYIFVVLDVGTRPWVHWNVTDLNDALDVSEGHIGDEFDYFIQIQRRARASR